jgi:hypothetical protein
MALMPLTFAGVVASAAPASAAGSVSAVSPSNGFPLWYQDAAGTRIDACLDPADANCVLPAAAGFDPAQPVVFPSNFPPEIFYNLADASIPTSGCAGSAPGVAKLRLAVEAAFLGGVPSPTDRMTFGRVRVHVSSGLCPNTTYQFVHPFGTETITTNDLGGVPAPVGTENIGCVPGGGVPCDFSLATGSRVFGDAATGGFLRWDAGAPAGYLGDGVTPHTINPGPNGATFSIVDPTAVNPTQTTSQFVVAGKISGALTAVPAMPDLGTVTLGSTSPAKTVTVTNVDAASVTLGGATLTGADAAQFAVTGGDCTLLPALARDASCTYTVTLHPTGVSGPRTATLTVPSIGGVRSPLAITLNGFAGDAGAAGAVTLNAASIAFGNVRVRETSALQRITVTNSGAAALTISDVKFDPTTFPEYDHYRIMQDTCSTGAAVSPGGTCFVDLSFAPFTPGAHNTAIVIVSNDPVGDTIVPVTGTGFGGLAAVATTKTTLNDGFPDWYMDDQGVKVAQCTDQNDPNCVLLPDQFYNPALPVSFPGNFPVEFFYQVATSDNLDISDPLCGSAPGKAFMRSAIEGAFPPSGPAAGAQLVFGRIRFSVVKGLCPNTEYLFTSPYGADRFTTDAAGGLKRKDGTNDVGCLIGGVGTCDFSLALSSRVLGSVLRWDPAAVPAAPAGYLGDAKTLHTIVGAPYSPDGITPANYFSIARADDGIVLDQTNQFTVMGKLQGPLESDVPTLDFGAIGQGSTSGTLTATLSNTGIAPLTIDAAGITAIGADAADFTVDGGTCIGATLAVGSQCTVSATFSPTAAGARHAQIRVRHSGLNNPMDIGLTGVGGAVGTAANISFGPRALAFGSLHTGVASEVETLTVSNAGGTLPLSVHTATITGVNAAEFAVVDNRCDPLVPVPVGGSCQIDVAFSATSAGLKSAALTVTDNAPGGTHSAALTATGSTAPKNVSATVDSRNGFPSWYQDDNSNRVDACLDLSTGHCVLLGDAFFNPNNPVVFPTNFPGEFFYALADSQLVTTPGCPAAGIGQGTALLRVALEGSFANGVPIAGDQITFGRIRVKVTGGLCPNTPYTFVTPWGPVSWTTDGNGGIAANAGTTNVGSTPANAALAAPIASGFPRWNPNVAPLAPAGFLGDGTSYHSITGGTYVPAAGHGAFNAFAIQDAAGNVIATTDQFLVSGRLAGPLQADQYALDYGHTNAGTPGATKTVTLTNVQAATTIGSAALGGANGNQFTITGGTCVAPVNAPVGADGTCTVSARFTPTTAGSKVAILTVTPATGPSVTVSLTGIADVVGLPAATVSPGALAFGTRNAGTNTTLTTTITNSGTAPLTVSARTIVGTAAGDYTFVSPAVSPCASIPFTLAVGASCSVGVSFSPNAGGVRSATLAITHNATGGATAVSLSGTGVVSTIVMSPSPVGFSNVNRNTTKTQTISVRNSGTLAVRLTSAAIVTAAPAGTFTVNGAGCIGTTLASGKSCSVSVSFRPTAVQAYSGTLQVFGDLTTRPNPVTNALTGTGK